MDCSSAYFNRFIYLDVNNDSQKDFLIRSDGFNGALGGATNTNYVSIFPLDINGFIRYGKDSVYNSYTGHWQYGEFAKPLHLGDTN